jgi:ABC-type sugar transport system permease subunit
MATNRFFRGSSSRNLPAISSGSLLATALRLIALALIDGFAVWFVVGMIDQQDYILAVFVVVVTVGINVAYLVGGLYPFRWFSPGLVLLIIMLIYPTVFTLYVAFTNYKDGNLLTQSQAQKVLLNQTYLPADAPTYSWTAFRSTTDPNEYALWLIPDTSTGGQPVLAKPGELIPADQVDLGGNTLDENGVPTGLKGYERISKGQVLALLDSVLSKIEFGEPGNIVMLNPTNPIKQAGVFRPKYTSNKDGTLLDNETEVLYKPVQGTYTPVQGPHMNAAGQVTDAEGNVLPVIRPGYYVVTGLENIKRLVSDSKIRGPFIRVFLWTMAQAFFTVFLTFSFGLFLAVVLNAKFMPGRGILRTLLLVPYAMPAFISVLVWKGLLNEQLGVINKAIHTVFGINGPRWFNSPLWVKVGILLVQLWLGFPYMMLITTGALQSIPTDIYEAARVDGAGALQQFRHLTLPMLLVAVGPLLIASFAFNFNNFTIVQLYNQGGPPITPDNPAGQSDILITYTYKLAFGSGRGADYGFASTITLVIFLMVAAITFFNFRFTRTWEEISENV